MNIKDMTNAELCAFLRGSLRGDLGEGIELTLIERIEQLEDAHRWIPVSERMPTEADENDNGNVLWWADYSFDGVKIDVWDFPDSDYTHWKRITPPEGA